MKSMTCNDLGGACDQKLSAETWKEMAQKSKDHAMEMVSKDSQAHMVAMEAMKDLMADPKAMDEWFQSKKKLFESLPEN